MPVLTPRSVWRYFTTDGVPSSGKHDPRKSEIIQLLDRIMETTGAGVSRATLADLQSVVPAEGDFPLGLVTADPTLTNIGIYTWTGAAWQKDRAFPDTMSVLTDVAGTADAITASTLPGIDPSEVVALVLQPIADNTGDVTLSVNGAAALPVRDSDGSEIAPSGLVSGRLTLMVDNGDEYRLLVPVDTLAAAASAAQSATDAAATLAEFLTHFLGNFADDTAAATAAGTPVEGQFYWNTTSKVFRYYDGSAWNAFPYATVADASLTEPKYATGSVSTRALADGAATTDKLGSEAVTEAKILSALVSDFRLVDPNGPRNTIRYYGPHQIQIAHHERASGGGHRFFGRLKRNRVPTIPLPTPTDDCRHLFDWGDGTALYGSADLAFEAYATQETWMAAYWAWNDGDAVATKQIVPFLRVGSVAGSVITLGSTEENVAATTAKTHQFATDALVGSEVLVINETLNSRTKAWSGRLATVTANTDTTVTLDDVGTMDEGDWFIPAPLYDHYEYIGCWYAETGAEALPELRNIADSGTLVQTRGVNNLNLGAGALDGDLSASGVTVPFDTLISPLAAGVGFRHTDTVSSSSTGSDVVEWGMDASHEAFRAIWYKDVTTSRSFVTNVPLVLFSFFPTLHFQNATTTFGAATTRSVLIQTWIEL